MIHAPLSNDVLVLQRQLTLAMRRWEDWKIEAMRLNDRLQRYEPGSPMLLNKQKEN